MLPLHTILLLSCLFGTATSLTDLDVGAALRAAGPELAAALPYDIRQGVPWPTPDDEVRSIEDAKVLPAWDERMSQVPDHQRFNQKPAVAWDAQIPPSDLSGFEDLPQTSHLSDDVSAISRLESDTADDVSAISRLGSDTADDVSAISRLGSGQRGGLDLPLPPEAAMPGLDRGQNTANVIARVMEAAALLEQDAAMLSGQLQALGTALQQKPPIANEALQLHFPSAAPATVAANKTRALPRSAKARTLPKVALSQQVPQQHHVVEKTDCFFSNEECGSFKKYLTLNYKLDIVWAIALWVIVIFAVSCLCNRFVSALVSLCFLCCSFILIACFFAVYMWNRSNL